MDEYLVFFNSVIGAELYYKNKILHREIGPAVILRESLDDYKHLAEKDNHLYKRVYKSVDAPLNLVTNYRQQDGTISTFSTPFPYYLSNAYYWEGTSCTEEQHSLFMERKVLNEQLNSKLISKKDVGKKTKV